jgi:hypothetical protein
MRFRVTHSDAVAGELIDGGKICGGRKKIE